MSASSSPIDVIANCVDPLSGGTPAQFLRGFPGPDVILPDTAAAVLNRITVASMRAKRTRMLFRAAAREAILTIRLLIKGV
jgi:hypothetical protein